MVAGSILPVSYHNNKVYFLFGKENPMEDSAKGFSDFGGRIEEGESPYDGALREGAEELTGFLGDKEELHRLIQRQGEIYTHTSDTYHVHMFYYPYDENLVKYYNQNHDYLWSHMDTKILNESKLFEKIEIQWFEARSLKKHVKKFRPFYQKIVMEMLKEMPAIERFVKSKRRHNKTHKKKGDSGSLVKRTWKISKNTL